VANEPSVLRVIPIFTTPKPVLFHNRDCWTRYIGVGNMFSGLEIPFEDRPELQPNKVACLTLAAWRVMCAACDTVT
jgi:hypothetical protein